MVMKPWALVLVALISTGPVVAGCTAASPSPTPEPHLTQALVVEKVLERWNLPRTEDMILRNPGILLVRLMTPEEYETNSHLPIGTWLTDQKRDQDALIWVVQVKLTADFSRMVPVLGSTSIFPELTSSTPIPHQPIYAVSVLDDLTGIIFADIRSYEPVISL